MLRKTEETRQIGHGILHSFAYQQEILARIRKRTQSIYADIGFSANIARFIEKRSVRDKQILIGLSGSLLVFILLLYFWVVPRLFPVRQ